MKKKTIVLSLFCLLSPLANSAPVEVVTNRFVTADQMLLANEENESGEPFAEALGYNLDDLDPFVRDSPDAISYTLGIENYEYSRYQLGTVITRSGIGLHMMWSPLIRKMAAMEPDGFDGSMTGAPNGYNEDDELRKNIMNFANLTGHAPPGNPWPQFAEFISADPHLPQAIDPVNFAWTDFSTLRWDRDKMKKVLNPAAMGQSLMKQYLWAQDMLSAFHDGNDNGIAPDGVVSPDFPDSPLFDPNNNVFFGGDSLDGFIGMVITAESINKVTFLNESLAFDGTSLRAVNPATYDPQQGLQYFPHKIRIREAAVHPGLPPSLSSRQVVDGRSFLFDQSSMLWGTASFTNMMDPADNSDAAHLAYHEVFDGSPFPAARSQSGLPGPYDLMKGTSRILFLNLMAMHYDSLNGTFVDVSGVHNKQAKPGKQISTVNAAYLIVALEPFIEEFQGTPLATKARIAVKNQARFLVSRLGNGRGGYANKVSVRSHGRVHVKSLAAQAAAIRGLYVAHRITGLPEFQQAADAAYNFLLQHFYVPGKSIFRTRLAGKTAHYTPRRVALVSAALREAALEGGHTDAPAIYTAFFRHVGRWMQLSEGTPTGEAGGDSDGDGIPYIPEQPDGLPPIFATKAKFHLK